MTTDPRVRLIHAQIYPPISWWEVAVMFLVSAFVGAMLAVGGVL